MYVVDAVVTTKAVVENLNPRVISAVNVMDGDAATATYGEKAKNGAVIVTTKIKANTKVNVSVPVTVKVSGDKKE